MTKVIVVSPKPNQISRIGSQAMSPMAWKKSRIGQNAACARPAEADQDAERNADRDADRRPRPPAADAVVEIGREDALVERSQNERTTSTGPGKEDPREDLGRGHPPPERDQRHEGHERLHAGQRFDQRT
jgi:hypothetical protein